MAIRAPVFVRWNTFFANPPLVIARSDLREAFDIVDRGLAITDAAVAGGGGR